MESSFETKTSFSAIEAMDISLIDVNLLHAVHEYLRIFQRTQRYAFACLAHYQRDYLTAFWEIDHRAYSSFDFGRRNAPNF
jgi:hypothetical protein